MYAYRFYINYVELIQCDLKRYNDLSGLATHDMNYNALERI